MESYLQELKQLLQQYFLLLNGSRKMTGKLQALDVEFDVGHDAKLEIIPVEWSPGNWFPSVRGTGSWGQYALWEGGLILYKNVNEKVAINLYEYTRTNYAYVAYQVDLEFYTSSGKTIFDSAGDINFTSRTGLVNFVSHVGSISLAPEKCLQVGNFSSLPQNPMRSALINKTGVPFPVATPDVLYVSLLKGWVGDWFKIVDADGHIFANDIFLDRANEDIRLYRAGPDLLGIADDVQLDDDRFLKPGKDSDGSLPTPSADYRGKMIRTEGGTGVADKVCVCVKRTDDSYGWFDVISGGFA